MIDAGVHEAHPDLIRDIERYAGLNRISLIKDPLVVPGGERVKGDHQVLENLYRIVAEDKIDRHSYILVIGGGAVIDAVGYAAATAHRGIRLIRMPTTVLAQNDAGIGVKNGVNHLDRKNFLGTFTPPYAVINDFNFLASLNDRDRRAGMAEAVKVALIKDARFFDTLFDERFALAKFEEIAVQKMIVRCAELHLDHIRSNGDPFELGSARPLDFGHWSAHKLEVLSGYEIRHGEAVAIGIVLDSLYSLRKRTISKREFERILHLIETLGFRFDHPVLENLDVKSSLEEFREHLGGNLSITLLSGIGRAHEVNEIDVALMCECMKEIHSFSKKV